ncbi:MAG: helix-turn-helix transcriptional regulator [Pseudomonadota bacterium]
MVTTDIAYFFIGYSWLSALILIAAHLIGSAYASLPKTRGFGLLLLLNLSAVQGFHYWSLSTGTILWDHTFYIFQVMLTAPLFLYFSRGVLTQEASAGHWKYLTLLPPLIGLFLPGKLAFILGFFSGVTYYAFVARLLFTLRKQRKQVLVEALALTILVVAGTVIVLLGITMPDIAYPQFVAVYSILIGTCFLPAMYIVTRFPDVISMAEEMAMTAYANSTLGNVNVDEKLEALQKLMLVDKLYTNENLSLATVAECLALSTHQASELFNVQLQCGFSRYIRQHRIEEAKRLLHADRNASVLSIGLSVGYTSQSSFYSAFKELTGMSPGQYRH